MAEVSHLHWMDHRTSWWRVISARVEVVLLLLVAGCANARHYRGLEMGGEQAASVVALPAVAQAGNNDCGYAAMASVALYFQVDPQRLATGPVPETFRNSQMSAADLIKMAKMLDLTAFGYQGDVEDLQKNITNGRPVLTLLNHPPRLGNYPGLEWWGDLAAMPFTIPHWVVVVGFDAGGDVVLHDPNKGLVSMNKRGFVDQWKKRSQVAVLVVAKAPGAQDKAGNAAAK
jgi:ABC-type bacteriocin/lantibiotic exporter with double-glycine peptidase domain